MPTPATDVAHLLRRAGFGGTYTQVKQLSRKTLPDIVDILLDTAQNPPVVPPDALFDPQRSEYDRWVAVLQYWIDRMRTVPAPVQEKLTLFWHGHFCSSQDKVFSMKHMWDQNQLFRQEGMGDFEKLCQKMAIQPAMLIYLDNVFNEVGIQQENFARELMELFTLGANQYTQDDIVSAARGWTGHGLDPQWRVYKFRSWLHDSGQKTFFGRTKNWDGPAIITELFRAPQAGIAARFIVRKLWSFFAYPNPDPALIDELAVGFQASRLNVKQLLKTTFLRPEFYSAAARGALVRSPIEFAACALKYTGLTAKLGHPEWWLEGMGQAPFYPPNVSGWRQNSYWISSSSYWSKAEFVRYVTWQAVDRHFLKDTDELSVADAVKAAFQAFNIFEPSPTTKGAIEAWLTAERGASGWAEQPNLITLSMLSPDFQLA